MVAWAVLIPTFWQINQVSANSYVNNSIATTYNSSASINDFYANLNWSTTLTSQNRIDMSKFINDRFSSDITDSWTVTNAKVDKTVKSLWESLVYNFLVAKGWLSTRLANAKTEAQKRSVLNDAAVMMTLSYHKNASNHKNKDFTDEAKAYIYAFQIIENYAKSNGIKLANGWEFTVIDQVFSNKSMATKISKWTVKAPWVAFNWWKTTWNWTVNNPSTWWYTNNNNTVNPWVNPVNDNIDQKLIQDARNWLSTNNGRYTRSELLPAARNSFWENSWVYTKIVWLINWQFGWFNYNYKVESSSTVNTWNTSWSIIWWNHSFNKNTTAADIQKEVDSRLWTNLNDVNSIRNSTWITNDLLSVVRSLNWMMNYWHSRDKILREIKKDRPWHYDFAVTYLNNSWYYK